MITEYMSMKGLCEHLGVCKSTVYTMIRKGELPKPIRKGKSVYFFGASVEKAERALIARAEKNLRLASSR